MVAVLTESTVTETKKQIEAKVSGEVGWGFQSQYGEQE